VRKLIVISAPSGAGKTSIVHYLLKNMPELAFSVSACSREKRENEIHGEDYYFLGVDGFKNKIAENAFLEWEQVYENQYYGTLTSEIERIWSEGKTVIFDVDVVGGLNIKKQYSTECLSIFIMPPSLEVLQERLVSRGSESEESLQKRLDKAEEEIAKNQEFDSMILNDNFDIACKETMGVIRNFIKS
jgi:guanylate kinase